MTVLLFTIYVGIGLNTDITTGVFDRFQTVPIWRPVPIAGALLGDVGRYLLAASLVITLGLVLGFRPARSVAGVLVAAALVLVFALSLSWIWTVLGLVMRAPTAVMSVSTVLLFPLTMASTVFVDPHTMPGWLQAFVNVNPVTHLVTAARPDVWHGDDRTDHLDPCGVGRAYRHLRTAHALSLPQQAVTTTDLTVSVAHLCAHPRRLRLPDCPSWSGNVPRPSTYLAHQACGEPRG